MKLFKFVILITALMSTEFAKATLPASTMKDIENFSNKLLDEKTDFAEVTKTIEILLILDEEDPSRTAVLMLSKSYIKHSALYDRAIKSVENKQNKKRLTEIREILKNFYKKGNG